MGVLVAEELPELLFTHRVADEISKLGDALPNIHFAVSDTERWNRLRDLEKQIDQLRSQIGAIPAQSDGKPAAGKFLSLEKSLDLLRRIQEKLKNVKKLLAEYRTIVEKVIVTQKQEENLIRRFEAAFETYDRALDDANREMRALVSRALAADIPDSAASGRLESRLDSFLANEMSWLGTIQDLRANAREMRVLVEAAKRESDAAGLDQFARKTSDILWCMNLHKRLPETPAIRVLASRTEMLADRLSGQSSGSLFSARKSEIAAKSTLESSFKNLEGVMKGLRKDSADLVKIIGDHAQVTVQGSTDLLNSSKNLLLGFILLAAVGSLFTIRYSIWGRVVRRIEGLTDIMLRAAHEILEGKETRFDERMRIVTHAHGRDEISAMGESLTIFIEAISRREAEARRLADEAEVLGEIGQIISSTLNIDEVYEIFASVTRTLIPFSRISINLVRPENSSVTVVYSSGIDVPGRGTGDTFPLPKATRTSLLIQPESEEEVQENFPFLLPHFRTGLKSFMIIPLISRDEVIGLLSVQAAETKAYTERDLGVAERIASRISPGIANAQLFQEVQEGERFLSNIFSSIRDGISILDEELNIVRVNPAREQMFPDVLPLEGKKCYAAFQKRTRPCDARICPAQRTIASGEVAHDVVPTQGQGGDPIWLDVYTYPLIDVKTGHTKGVIEYTRDVTDLKMADERLKRSEEHFRSLIENSSDIILEGNQDAMVTYVTPSVEHVLGYRPESVIGQSAFSFVHPEDARAAKRMQDRLQILDVATTSEYRLKHADGSWRIFQAIGKSNRDETGKARFVVNFRDITAQRNLERQLAQAQKLEAVGQLAAGIAHEINSPIQYIGDNTRFFQSAFRDFDLILAKYEGALKEGNGGPFPPALQEWIDKIDLPYLKEEVPKAIEQTLEGVERVSNIVRAMKEFSHPGAKEMSSVDLNRAIQNTIVVARNEWKYVAEMETDLDPFLPPISCLPGEVNQVILNLIINSAHAIADVVGDGSAGKGAIRISTHRAGESVEIRVQDTGTGIPERIRSRIFDPFFTTKEVGRGTGQGLAIAHSVIVDKHGGSIRFETEMGKGTTFIIRLPIESERISDGKENSLRR